MRGRRTAKSQGAGLALRLFAMPVGAAAALAACIATAPDGLHRLTDTGGGGAGGGIDVDAAPPDDLPDGSTTKDPHGVAAIDPSHGPFTGGDKVILRGKGFTSKARVWFGASEVMKGAIFPIDPTRLQLSVPPGAAGSVDVAVQNGDDQSTRRTLVGGYTYDALFAAPDSGPVPGGTVIEILGQGTAWDATTVATIDNKPCTTLDVVSPTLLSCTVPQGSPGSKPIKVTTGKETIIVLDAFTYEDSDNGFKGGLSGAPLAGHMKALVYDNFTGDPIPGASVIVGTDFATAIVKTTDNSGVAVIHDASLTTAKTVTITGYCHSPITFVDDPVDTITVYLDPVLTPDCAGTGDPPPVGGKVGSIGYLSGQLVWPVEGEFKKGAWKNVPQPIGPNEKKTAYVFLAYGDPAQPFQLPDPSLAVHEDTPGDVGYQFQTYAAPGNRTLYALAGLEDDSVNPRRFTAYAMGVLRGIPVLPNGTSDSLLIPMNETLDHQLTLDVSPPAPGPRGPDHLHATVSVMLGNDGFVVLPIGTKDPLLPLAAPLNYVGVPNLDGDLSGSTFFIATKAATGPSNTAPISAIGRLLTNDTSKVVKIDGFVGVPTLTAPAEGAAWDAQHLTTSFGNGGAPIDITVYDVTSGNGLAHWLVASPNPGGSITLPDISSLASQHATLIPGPLLITVYGGHITNFDYKKARYRDLRSTGMTAYSVDVWNAHL